MKDKRKIPASVKELLCNPLFVLWCYSPTSESEEWWENWIKEFPERKQDLVEARSILLASGLGTTPFPEDESAQLYLRIRESAARRKAQRKKRYMLQTVAAACVACLLAVGLWIYIPKGDVEENLHETGNLVHIDSNQVEIELELGGEQKLLLDNQATIRLNEEGTIHINDEEIANINTKSDLQDTTNPIMNVLKVPRGRHTDVYLPDGSRVWVNSETVLQFPDVFGENERAIHVDGEVYLEVAKDASRPFRVRTSQMDIHVLGTSFNVTAYKDENTQAVVLKEGLVEITTSDGQKQSLTPRDRLVLEADRINISKVDPYYYTSWTDGIFLFEKETLEYISHKLSRYYKMNFVCIPEVENYKCSGKLVLFNDINKVLHTLEESLPVSCEIDGDTIKISFNP